MAVRILMELKAPSPPEQCVCMGCPFVKGLSLYYYHHPVKLSDETCSQPKVRGRVGGEVSPVLPLSEQLG